MESGKHEKTKKREVNPKKIRQITQINKILPEKNDPQRNQDENQREKPKFHTGSTVKIIPNNPEQNNQKDIHPLTERYQDVNTN